MFSKKSGIAIPTGLQDANPRFGLMLILKSGWYILIIGSCFYFSSSIAAEVPVIDESVRMQDASASSKQAVPVKEAYEEEDSDEAEAQPSKPAVAALPVLSLEQRLNRLEKQMSAREEITSELEALRQEVSQLRGSLEESLHQTKQNSVLQTASNSLAAVSSSSASAVLAPTPVVTSETDPKEVEAYQKGYDAVKVKDFERAKSAFLNYLQTYSKGIYVANAHYWLGEIYLNQGALAKASTEFNQVLANPKNPKYPEALLKIGFIYSQQNNWPQARQQFNAVKQKFPGTTAALLADERLQEMTQQGH